MKRDKREEGEKGETKGTMEGAKGLDANGMKRTNGAKGTKRTKGTTGAKRTNGRN